jgi:hypothetical protein
MSESPEKVPVEVLMDGWTQETRFGYLMGLGVPEKDRTAMRYFQVLLLFISSELKVTPVQFLIEKIDFFGRGDDTEVDDEVKNAFGAYGVRPDGAVKLDTFRRHIRSVRRVYELFCADFLELEGIARRSGICRAVVGIS